MNTIIINIQNNLNENFLDATAIDNPLERLNSVSKYVDNALLALNQHLKEHLFDSAADEIAYFKNIKPEILAHRLAEGLRYSLEVNKPIGTSEVQLKYFDSELNALQSFFRQNPFYYQYFRNQFSELDNLFFLRNSGPLPVPIIGVTSNIDGEFSPPMSYLFAKFLAYEKIQYFILEQMVTLKNPEIILPVLSSGSTDLKWTGDSINIVELAYGLWLTGQLNNGNASLNQIVRWLEANLQVSIGIVQRRFDEIGRRKRLSPTRYIDQMREKVLQKIDDKNA